MTEARPAWTSEAVVETFLGFFQARGHLLVPSSSLVPEQDPTVLLTTAGMQQFVPYMLGQQVPPAPRLCSLQKCFRTTDIDKVGNLRNLTFFEMLGNFSIGDYFKEEIVPWALELVTQGFQIPLDRLWVTVHPTDDESAQLWSSVGLPSERIVPDEENFWGPPGASGPCGPDTEIYYDWGAGLGCGRADCRPGCDCERYLEIWNLVLMQYFQEADGSRRPLTQRNIDTGAGLERVTSVLQGVGSVYETDLFLPVIRGIEELAGARYGEAGRTDFAFRVLADHGRAITFLVGDGVLPSNEGRGYVLRRILRRAVRYGRTLGIDIDRPFLADLVDLVADRMGGRYPVLAATRDYIGTMVRMEEERFRSILGNGNALLRMSEFIEEARSEGKTEISGRRVFRLYDAYGFPFELSEEIAAEAGMTVPREEFESEMEAQRKRSRAATRFGAERESGTYGALSEATYGELSKHTYGDLSSGTPSRGTKFLGYEHLDAPSLVLALEGPVGAAQGLAEGQPGKLVLAATPFYAEGGGQVGDTGEIVTSQGRFQVEDTQRDGPGHIIHIGRVVQGELRVGDQAEAVVDRERRWDIMRHHSVTHLLHQALRQTLGPQATQAGSLVSPHLARFDFPYGSGLETEQVKTIEDLVNQQILADLPVEWEEKPLQEALQEGAAAFFGEKYGDRVRVVMMGSFSKELCGGTHVQSTGQLGAAYIAAEYGIGSGMRRVEVVAGRAAHEFARQRSSQISALAERLGTAPEQLDERVESLLLDLRDARRALARAEAELGKNQAGSLAERARDVGGIRLVAERVEAASMDALLQIKDVVQQSLGTGVIVLGTVLDSRPQFVAAVSKDLVRPNFDAAALIREMASVTGGSGGGRPELARAGGGDPAKLDAALERAAEVVRSARSQSA